MSIGQKIIGIEEQMQILQSKGICFENEDFVRLSLLHVGYERLQEYFSVFEKCESFCFEEIIALYDFDRELRILFFEEIERIEISFQSLIICCLERHYGSFFHTKKEIYLDEKCWEDEMEKFSKVHWKKEITENIPSSVYLKTISFGQISTFYKKLKTSLRKEIALFYSIDEQILTSWIMGLVDIRNIVSHNNKLWNANLSKKIKLPKHTNIGNLLGEKNKILPYFFVIFDLLKIINPKTSWDKKILFHLEKLPQKFFHNMGFPEVYPQNLFYLFSFYNMTQNSPFLQNPEIIQWCQKGITEFSLINTSKPALLKISKKTEDEWGSAIIGNEGNGQWTTLFCENLVKESLVALGRKNVRKTQQKKSSLRDKKYDPDLECDEFVYEVKGRTWNTSGTAGEKILGVPLKYAEIPKLYGKPLKIILVGYQEWEARNAFAFGDLLDSQNQIPEVAEALAFYKKRGIEYIGFTDILKELGLFYK